MTTGRRAAATLDPRRLRNHLALAQRPAGPGTVRHLARFPAGLQIHPSGRAPRLGHLHPRKPNTHPPHTPIAMATRPNPKSPAMRPAPDQVPQRRRISPAGHPGHARRLHSRLALASQRPSPAPASRQNKARCAAWGARRFAPQAQPHSRPSTRRAPCSRQNPPPRKIPAKIAAIGQPGAQATSRLRTRARARWWTTPDRAGNSSARPATTGPGPATRQQGQFMANRGPPQRAQLPPPCKGMQGIRHGKDKAPRATASPGPRSLLRRPRRPVTPFSSV